MKTKLIQALLSTLLETYGNEAIYHPDGTAYDLIELTGKYLSPEVELPEGTEPLACAVGAAIEIDHYESIADNVVHELLSLLSPNDDLFSDYYELRDGIQARARENFPTIKFSNF